jgi:hypothetical protein
MTIQRAKTSKRKLVYLPGKIVTHLQEARNKKPISEPTKLFLAPAKVQFGKVVRIEDFYLKSAIKKAEPLLTLPQC